MRIPFTSTVEALPVSTPFVGPEALERRTKVPIELRLGANESPFGPSPLAIQAMRDHVLLAEMYGDPECYLMRCELSTQLGAPIECISAGAGVDELLGLCCRLFCDPGAPIVTTLGSYATFEFVARTCGVEIHYVPYKDESPDLEGLADLAEKVEARIVYLANPDNPSGAWHSDEAVARFRTALPAKTILFLDEAYCDFAPSTPELNVDDRQVIRFRTFSKVHGMAGMRVGYVVAHPDYIRALDKVRNHFAVNCVAQAGALATLRDRSHANSVVAETAKGKAEMANLFSSLGLRPLPSHTNFLTVDVGSKARAEAILDALLDHGVFIRKPGAPPLDVCIRVTIGRPEQRARFAEIFAAILPMI